MSTAGDPLQMKNKGLLYRLTCMSVDMEIMIMTMTILMDEAKHLDSKNHAIRRLLLLDGEFLIHWPPFIAALE